MYQLNIYSAGAMTTHDRNNEFHKAVDWRRKAKQLFPTNVYLFDPTQNYETNSKYDLKNIPYQNLHFLNKCDIMLLNLEKLDESPGTLFEIFNYFFNKKPIIAFGHSEWLWNPHIHESITIKFETLDEAIKHIKSMYL